MMKKHDERIQNLFDDYAEQLTPRQDLAEKAKMEMVADKQAKPSPSSRPKTSFWTRFAWITSVAAVFIAIIVIIFSLPTTNDGMGNMSNGSGPQQSAPAVVYYSYADVKGKSVYLDDYDDVLQISKLSATGYQVVGQRYYGFFTQDGQLRYVKAQLGVRSTDGTFTELELIAEVDGYVRRDLRDIYDRYSSTDGLKVGSGYDVDGEYVTQGYFAARNLHFYVMARNGQRSNVAEDIMRLLAEATS